ncbi:hypothetical protein D1631_00030 [Chryseobacterium nematophagum]|uniref:Uncharacterized protein n=1 Tax=Chryseobacterium nematophagum TaxID=2305228 RepID=A0A3M7TK50_9FLAO|nr:hypothetical protein D1631_00030 [Chryseobacterium nematophagum]
MSKNLFVTIFLGLIVFMFCDIFFTFSNFFKGIFYGVSFIVGLLIYFFYREFPKNDSDNGYKK